MNGIGPFDANSDGFQFDDFWDWSAGEHSESEVMWFGMTMMETLRLCNSLQAILSQLLNHGHADLLVRRMSPPHTWSALESILHESESTAQMDAVRSVVDDARPYFEASTMIAYNIWVLAQQVTPGTSQQYRSSGSLDRGLREVADRATTIRAAAEICIVRRAGD